MKTKDQEIICNCCKQVIRVQNIMPQTEFLHVEKTWGYFSGKDGECQEFDVCESCYDNWIKTFQIPVQVREVTELL